jgi:hypothetical protein
MSSLNQSADSNAETKPKFAELEKTIKELQLLRKKAEDLLKANITHEDFNELVVYYNDIHGSYGVGISSGGGASVLRVNADYNKSIGDFPDYLKIIFPGIQEGRLRVDEDRDGLEWRFSMPTEFQDCT